MSGINQTLKLSTGEEIRILAKRSGVPLWKIAVRLDMCVSSLSNRLSGSLKLTKETELKIRGIIKDLRHKYVTDFESSSIL